jgi:hypothetical protein
MGVKEWKNDVKRVGEEMLAQVWHDRTEGRRGEGVEKDPRTVENNDWAR